MLFKDLQLFAAGDTVNYAGNDSDANAGTMNANNGGAPVSTGDLSAEMKTFYDKTLITLAGTNLVHDQFGQKRPIPKNGGKNIEFRRFSKLPKALSPITEGVTPTGNKLKVAAITARVDQYGDYIEQTDMLELTAIDNTIVEATKELAAQAGSTLDTVVRNELTGGTNVMYGSKDGTPATSRADITEAHKLTVKDVFKAAAELKAVNAPKINGSYVAIIHPYVAYDIMQEAGDTWVDIQKYKNPEKIYRGEIGELGGVRFVESTEAKIIAPAAISDGVGRLHVKTAVAESTTAIDVDEVLTAGTYSGSAAIPVYVNGEENTIVAVEAKTGYSTVTLGSAVTSAAVGDVICGIGAGKDGSAVFCTLFLAENAYGVTDIEGGGLEHIVKQRGYGNDPLNQRSSVGWKATKTAKRLIEEYMIRFETGSAFSDTADEN